jgi:hypothetical protein
MPWLRQVFTGLSLERIRFNPRPVGIVVFKMELGEHLVFNLSIIVYKLTHSAQYYTPTPQDLSHNT